MTEESDPAGPGLPGPDDTESLRGRAIRSIRAKREFGTHFVIYLAVSALLVAVWLSIALAGGTWFPWPVFPIGGWGIGVAAHAWSVYGGPSRPISEEMIEREERRLRGE